MDRVGEAIGGFGLQSVVQTDDRLHNPTGSWEIRAIRRKECPELQNGYCSALMAGLGQPMEHG